MDLLSEDNNSQVCVYDQRSSLNKRMRSPSVHGEKVSDGKLHLECEEVIQNWDTIEGFHSLKNDSGSGNKSPSAYPSSVLQMYDDALSSDGPHMYDDVPPPNSPISGEEDKSNLLYAHNEYVSHLLNIWRESSEYSVSAESTQVNLDEFEYSQRWSLTSEDDFTPSQSSNGSSRGSHDSEDIHMEEGGSSLEHNSNSYHTTEQDYLETFRNISFAGTENRSNSSRSNSPLNLNSLGPYDLLRSVSPRILRSPSPVFPVRRLIRSPSPNWEELQANLSELTPQDVLLIADERYSVRSRSPASVSDQEVPDIEMDVQNFYSDSDDYMGNRGRTVWSCQDQVVPEFIEE